MYLFLRKYTSKYCENTERFILGTGLLEDDFYEAIEKDAIIFNGLYNKEIDINELKIKTLKSTCGKILYIQKQPEYKYFLNGNEENFDYDYIEYFAIPLENNALLPIPMAMQFFGDDGNTETYF